MSGTFSQIHIQVVFAVKYRQALINRFWEDELYKYITGIIQGKNQKLLAINGVPDHIHFLIGMRPSCCLSDLVGEVKKSSTAFLKNKFLSNFRWQDGYGAFSYSHSDIDKVIKYIMNQKKRHKKQTFKEEYLELLEKFEIDFDEKYLFNWL